MSSMLSAPATIPATRDVSFSPAFAPLSVGTVRWSWASSWSSAERDNAMIGTSPADDTRFGSSKTADVAAGSAARRCTAEDQAAGRERHGVEQQVAHDRGGGREGTVR